MRQALSSQERGEASGGTSLLSKEIDRRTKSRTAMPRAHRRADAHLPSGSDPERWTNAGTSTPSSFTTHSLSLPLPLSESAKIANCWDRRNLAECRL